MGVFLNIHQELGLQLPGSEIKFGFPCHHHHLFQRKKEIRSRAAFGITWRPFHGLNIAMLQGQQGAEQIPDIIFIVHAERGPMIVPRLQLHGHEMKPGAQAFQHKHLAHVFLQRAFGLVFFNGHFVLWGDVHDFINGVKSKRGSRPLLSVSQHCIKKMHDHAV